MYKKIKLTEIENIIINSIDNKIYANVEKEAQKLYSKLIKKLPSIDANICYIITKDLNSDIHSKKVLLNKYKEWANENLCAILYVNKNQDFNISKEEKLIDAICNFISKNILFFTIGYNTQEDEDGCELPIMLKEIYSPTITKKEL